MRFSLKSSGRTKSTHDVQSHPDLPLSWSNPKAKPTHHHQQQQQQQPPPPPPQHSPHHHHHSSISRSASHAGDRRSIAILPSADPALRRSPNPNFTTANPSLPDDRDPSEPAFSPSALGRSHTVASKRDSSAALYTTDSPRHSQIYNTPPPQLPATPTDPADWSPDFAQLPTLSEQPRIDPDQASMSGAQHASAPAKTSSDSGQSSALDRWSQRRLQRLNTEQGFREQRQGTAQSAGSADQQQQPVYNNNPAAAAAAIAQQQQQQQQQQQPSQPYITTLPQQDTQPQSTPIAHQPPQPHPAGPYPPSARTAHPNSGLAGPARSPNYPPLDPAIAATQAYSQSQPQYSPPDAAPQYHSQDGVPRSSLSQPRSFPPQITGADDPSMSSSNNGSLPAPKSVRSSTSNRQSVHNGFSSRESSNLGAGQQGQQQPGMPAFNASIVPATGQTQQRGQAGQQDLGRGTPQPAQLAEDMSEEDVTQLIKDHKELREKYTKVKKYYFEKEDQVKQLQNSLAHQRLSQSRTSLDDSEYATRFNRLDGLIAQLAFSIRKSWRSIPQWLATSVNKDAVTTGKQEMTAAGRAYISWWLVEEVFNKYFHPDLEPSFSAQLKMIQLNIRRFATPARNTEEEEYLTSKVVNWRLATLEGLHDTLRSPQCPTYRAQLTESLKDNLIRDLSGFLENPPMSDLEGGVHMITELVVSIAIHLPVESRDVVIDYFMPGYSIMTDHMKLESGIPLLTVSVADDAAERASMKSATSDITDSGSAGATAANNGAVAVDQPPKKRGMLGALTSTKKSIAAAAQGKHAGAGGSSSSLTRPESAHGPTAKEDLPPRVRMAAGIGIQIRGRGVLVKAPVFST